MPRRKNEKINKDIARLYLMGYTLPQIAEKVGVTPRTISNHLGDMERHWDETWNRGYHQAKLAKIAEINYLKTSIADKRDSLEDPTEWRKYTEAIVKLLEIETKILGLDKAKTIDVSPLEVKDTDQLDQIQMGQLIGGFQFQLAERIEMCFRAIARDPGNLDLLGALERYVALYSSFTGFKTYVNHDAAIKTLSDWGYIISHPNGKSTDAIYSKAE